MQPRVAIYARVSKSDRDDASQSITVQLADCRERAEEQGWKVVEEYVDEGASAWNPRRKRPAYERLISDMRTGRVDGILVRETERLLRQQKDAVEIQDLAEAGHLKLIACTLEGDINFARARDRKDFRDRASAAEFYSDFLGEKIKRTKQRQIAAGNYTGGGASFGYKITKTGPVVDPAQAALIHDAVKRLAAHESLYRIVMDWNEQGVKTARGSRWRPEHLRRMLLSDHLTGANGYPRILDDVEAALVRQELRENQPKPKRGRPAGRRYMATGLVRCALCGVKMAGSGGSYRCSVERGGCGGVTIKAFPLERHLLREWTHHLSKNGDDGSTSAETAPDTSPILKELRAVERRLTEVADGLADGTLTVAVAGEATAKLEERRQMLTDQLAQTVPAPKTRSPFVIRLEDDEVIVTYDEKVFGAEAGEEYRRRWEAQKLTEAEVLEMRDVLGMHIDHVTVAKGVSGRRKFDPDRVSIGWR